LARLLQYTGSTAQVAAATPSFSHKSGRHAQQDRIQPQQPVTVLYVINDLAVGGAQRVLSGLIKQLDRSRFHPIVLNLGFAAGREIEQELQRESVTVIRKKSVVIGDLTSIYTIYTVIRQYRAFIVHSHLFWSNLYSAIACRWAHVPLIFSSEHNTSTFVTRPWWYRTLSRLYLHLNYGSFAVSHAVAQAMARLQPRTAHKVQVIHNGIDCRVFAPERYKMSGVKHSKADRFAVGTLVRPDPRKGFDIYIAMAGAVGEAIECTAGYRGPMPAVAGKVRWQAMSDGEEGTAKFLCALDVFVLPSREEGLGMVVLEAMAMGVAVVAADVGGVREIITSERNGLLVPPGNVSAFVNAIERMRTDKALRERCIAQGLVDVHQRFDVTHMAEKMQAHYEAALCRR
jgi:glycosyltransferase involved in cell wall biosynthesis